MALPCFDDAAESLGASSSVLLGACPEAVIPVPVPVPHKSVQELVQVERRDRCKVGAD